MIRRFNYNNIQLTNAQKQQLTQEIKDFFLNERDEKVDILASQQILDFFLENLSPIIYDKALDDAQKLFKQAFDNFEVDFYTLYKSPNI